MAPTAANQRGIRSICEMSWDAFRQARRQLGVRGCGTVAAVRDGKLITPRDRGFKRLGASLYDL